MEDKKKLDQIIRTVKELFIKHKKNGKELSKLIDKYLVPQETEVQKNGEVSTPWKERQQMLDLFPSCFWKSIKKVFEPCAGKGGFIIDIIDRFMTGLKEIIPDEKLRYKTIVEECLYFCDINSTNIFICKLLIDPDNEYKLNYYEGDSLKLSSGEICSPLANCIQWFDAVISNPPYNSSSGTGTGNGIWQKFTRAALNIWIKPNGYLAFVHPPGWRKPNPNGGRFGGLYRLMTQDNQMISLSMYGIDEGRRVFKRGTRYDIYIIQKRPQYKNTDVTDCKGKKMNINMSDFNWLPNFGIDTIQKLLAKPGEEKCEIIHSGVMDPRQKHMEKEGKRTEEYKYPCIHTIRKGGPRYLFSKRNDIGTFGVPKVIFGESVSAIKPVIDRDGQYGMTHHCMAIKINNEDGKLICQSLKSDKMKAFLESCLYSAWHIDWSIFKDLKKDFWKEFI